MLNDPPDGPHVVTSIPELARRVDASASGSRPFLLAVAGPPGSGKSYLARKLETALTLPACVIPMDGFHMDNDTLSRMDLLGRKGAPETFDLAGFQKLVTAVRDGSATSYPTFDRAADSVVPQGGRIPQDAQVFIFEGNYLLFDAPGWAELGKLWDASVFIDVPRPVLETRLVQRWLDHGLDAEGARARATGNDIPNAERVIAHVLPHTWRLVQ